jgi:hypothetical protein
MRTMTNAHGLFLLYIAAHACAAAPSTAVLPYPRSAAPAGTDGPLYLVSTQNMTEPADVVTLATLAGVLARRSPRIYVVNSDPAAFDPADPTSDTTVFWWQQMKAALGPATAAGGGGGGGGVGGGGGAGLVEFDEHTHLHGDLAGLLRRFAGSLIGYVTYSPASNSTNAALIHCAAASGGVLAVGTAATAALLDALSLPRLADLTHTTPHEALVAARYGYGPGGSGGYGNLTTRMAAFQPDDGGKAACLSAYAVFGRLPTLEDHAHGSQGFFEVLAGFKQDPGISAALGWTSWDEHELVAHVTAAGGYVHASDFLYNLEVSGGSMRAMPPPPPSIPPTHTRTHTHASRL